MVPPRAPGDGRPGEAEGPHLRRREAERTSHRLIPAGLVLTLSLLLFACGSTEEDRAEPLILRGEAASLIGEPGEALALLARLHVDRTAAWPAIAESDRIGLPRLEEEEGRILLPPGDWAENLPVVIAETIGPSPGGPLGARFRDPGFARLLRGVIVWNEAHVALLRGRLAYRRDLPAESERVAVRLTASALHALPTPDAEIVRSILSDYLEGIGARPDRPPRPIPPASWDRREPEPGPAWERLESQLGWLAAALAGKTPALEEIVEAEVAARWRRSLEGRIVREGGRVRTFPLSGDPIAAVGSDPDGGTYLLRGGRIEAVGPDGALTVLFSSGQDLFRPLLFAATGGGEILLVGEEEAMRLRFPEKSVQRLGPAPWRKAGRPRAVAAAADGSFHVAVGSEVFHLDPEGAPIGCHDAGGEIGGLAFAGGRLHASLSSSHRVVVLEGDRFEPLAGGASPGLQDGPDPTLNRPAGIAATADGSVVVADTLNHAIRVILPDGSARTIVGGGSGRRDGYARTALLSHPFAVAALPDGGIVFAEKGFGGIRVVSAEGEPAIPASTATEGIRPRQEVYASLDEGKALARSGQAEEATAAFDLAIEGSAIDPNLYGALISRAGVRSSLEDWEGAAADFHRAGDLAPGDVDAGTGEADALIRLQRAADASVVLDGVGATFLRSAVEERHRDPRYPRFHLLRARALALEGSARPAADAADEAIRVRETARTLYGVEWSAADGDLYLGRARILLSLGRADGARADADRALELAGESAAAHAVRGDALAYAGDLHGAAEAYKEAVRIDEKTKEAHIGLARLYCTTLDDREKAIHHLDRYLTLGGDERTAAEILSNLTATAKDRRGAYAEVIRVDSEGQRYRLRLYEDGSRVKIPYPWSEGE